MSRKSPEVDVFLGRATQWQKEMGKLRTIVLGCELDEDIKWGKPCYSFQKGNIVLIHGFKEYCALLFMQGALLKDPDGFLIQQTENTQAARQIRFTNLREIADKERAIKDYIQQAIEVEKAGLKFDFKPTEEFTMPEEFKKRLAEDPAFNESFYQLTPGRQRAYLLHFSAPKQSATRESRIEKNAQKILAGKGLNDK